MKLSLKWLLTACLLIGFADARPSSLREREYNEANLLRRTGDYYRSVQERRELALKLRLVDLFEAKRSAKEQDDKKDSTTITPAPSNATPSPTAAPITVLTPTGSVIVLASQGTTRTVSLNATAATATSTVVVLVSAHPGQSAAIGTDAPMVFTSLALVGALLGTYFS